MTLRRAVVPLVVAAALATLPRAPRAQSTRYPPPAPDLDAERESYSAFWENAIEPGLDRYADLVERSARLIGRRTDEARAQAVELLGQATALLPSRADAWAWLGLAREQDGDFAACHDALERAWTIDPAWTGPARPLAIAVGACRARTGDLEGAVDVLEQLIARGDRSVEARWRLGEAYMALGRLDDARAVLEIALDGSPADVGYVHAAWTLAVAADRARAPEATRAAAEIATRLDASLTLVEVPQDGYLSDADREYYLMVAADAVGWPHRALLHARGYLALTRGGDAPWVARAREHERALRSFALTDELTFGGTDPIDARAARPVLRAGAGDLRACMAKVPRALISVSIVLPGPPLPPPTSGGGPFPRPPVRRPSSPSPSVGVHLTVDEQSVAPDADLADARACVDKVAQRLAFPAPKTPGTWAMVTFPVIAE